MLEPAAPKPSSAAVSAMVRAFYEELPFNYEATGGAAVAQVRANPVRSYPDLDVLLRGPRIRSVTEIGCGAGWLSNSIALHYEKAVVAVDMTERALARARDVADALEIAGRVRLVQRDLFAFAPDVTPDLVVSVGVLHHTHDCEAAFRHLAGFLERGGFLFVGLYHAPGRRPFLSLFHEILAHQGEEAAFRRYRELNPAQTDETFLRSWFRDQVMHPHETQHTLAEVCGWLEDLGFALRSTSINRFQPFSDLRELFALEAGYAELSRQRNQVERRYFPGFFTILAERR